MPNLKIYVEEIVWTEHEDRMAATLPRLRDILCRDLQVDLSLCQLVIVPVRGLDDQAQVSAEIQILPKTERTRDVIVKVCSKLKEQLAEASKGKVSVRATMIDPESYLAIR